MKSGVSDAGGVDEGGGVDVAFPGDGIHETAEGFAGSCDFDGSLDFEFQSSLGGRDGDGVFVGHGQVVPLGLAFDVVGEATEGEEVNASGDFVAFLFKVELKVACVDPGAVEVVGGGGEGIDGPGEEGAGFHAFKGCPRRCRTAGRTTHREVMEQRFHGRCHFRESWWTSPETRVELSIQDKSAREAVPNGF